MHRFTRFVMIAATALIGVTARGQNAPSQNEAGPHYCAAPEFRQFAFWVGDWDVFEIDGTEKVAHVRVDSILDGCAIKEDYGDTNGLHGQSFSIYDAPRQLWHQTWVTNHGQLLALDGKFAGGEIVLNGIDRSKGSDALVRVSWKPVAGAVRETAVTSTDGGKTWKTWFDLMFRPAAKS